MNSETLLLRQVHPSFVQNGRITSQTFTPTLRDQNRLSVYDGDLIEAEPAWIHYTSILDLQSIGVVAVTVAECVSNGLAARPDPTDYPEHALIDFAGLRGNRIRALSRVLRLAAEKRGWLFR